MLNAFDLVYLSIPLFFCFLFGKMPKLKRLCCFAIFVVYSCTSSGPTRFVTMLVIGSFRLLVDSFLLFGYTVENSTKNILKMRELTQVEKNS